MLHIGTTGPKPEQKSLSAPAYEALQEQIRGEGFSGYTPAEEWLQREHGADLPYSTVHKIIRYRLKAKLKRARPRHQKNDSDAASFPARLTRFLDVLIAFCRSRVRLFVQDEARFGLHEGITRRSITAAGVKPHQLVLPRYKYT